MYRTFWIIQWNAAYEEKQQPQCIPGNGGGITHFNHCWRQYMRGYSISLKKTFFTKYLKSLFTFLYSSSVTHPYYSCASNCFALYFL